MEDISKQIQENSESLLVRPLTKQDEAYPQACKLYKSAFPFEERFSLPVLRFFARKPQVQFLAYFSAVSPKQLCGITYTIEVDRYLYVLYLAVAEHMRGQGFGTQILESLKERYPTSQLVLEIEPLDPSCSNYSQRVARLRFYERNGFSRVGYDMFEGRIRYTMLATGEGFDPDVFARQVRKISHGLYRVKIVPAFANSSVSNVGKA